MRPQGYSSAAIANELLKLSKQSSIDITPMALNKLVYLAHGWHLAFTGRALISERIEAWKYGPVVPSLYQEFKSFGDQPIAGVAFGSDTTTTTTPEIPYLPDDSEGHEAREIIQSVWERYGELSALRLSDITHQRDTPWWMVYESGRRQFGDRPRAIEIPNELILDHYQRLRKQA
ncbi:MAG: type II toxin-antitoxin system antitoxin SocA domain-containing protein [Planctomycetota bacterium]